MDVLVYPQQARLVATICLMWTLSTAAFVGRIASRRLNHSRVGWDDYLSAIAYAATSTYNGLGVQWVRYGWGMRLVDITWMTADEANYRARWIAYIGDAIYPVSILASKLAILSLYRRLFVVSTGNRRMRYAITFLATISCIWFSIRETFGIVQCIPLEKYIDYSIPGQCFWKSKEMFYGFNITHILIDALILILPLWGLRSLRLSPWRKFGVTIVFMFGIVVIIASVALIVASLGLDVTLPDLSYNQRYSLPWTVTELNLSVVSACLPVLRPIFARCLQTRRLRHHESSALPSFVRRVVPQGGAAAAAGGGAYPAEALPTNERRGQRWIPDLSQLSIPSFSRLHGALRRAAAAPPKWGSGKSLPQQTDLTGLSSQGRPVAAKEQQGAFEMPAVPARAAGGGGREKEPAVEEVGEHALDTEGGSSRTRALAGAKSKRKVVVIERRRSF